MTPEEEKIAAAGEKAVAKAKAPLLEDIHTLIREVADGHRRVDVAVQVRQQVEIDRNKMQAKMSLDARERAGLQRQVENLHEELGVAQKFHLDVLGCLASHAIPTPQAGYLKVGPSSILRDLDTLSRFGKKPL